MFHHFFRTIERQLAPWKQSQTFLEVGCGPGVASRRLASMLPGKHLEVSDFDERFVRKLAHSDFPLKISQESIYDLRREDESFDGVFCLEVLEHLDNADFAVKELFRVARHFVLISVPHEPVWSLANLLRLKYVKSGGNTPGHVNRFSPRTLKALISRFGHVEVLAYSFPWLVIVGSKKGISG